MGHPIIKSSGALRHGFVTAFCGLLMAVSCHSSPETSTDGETHFLRVCDSECGGGADLVCHCGLCTRRCSDDAACQELISSAECIVDVDRAGGNVCSEPPPVAFCDIPCAADDDCDVLSSSHRCVDGFCRTEASTPGTAGASGAGGGGAGGAGGEAGGAGGAGGAACPHGGVSGNEVIVLGDLYIAQTHQVTAYLEALARKAGALPAGERYRDYSSTTSNGFITGDAFIADQYATAQAEGTVRVVVMNGGGADLLMGICDTPPTADCQVMVDVVAAAGALLDQMFQDGVEDVVYFSYPDVADATLLAKMDVLRPLLQSVCDSSEVACHFIDLRPTFEGHNAEYLMVEDTLPTDEGAQVTAAVLWSTMQQNCIAQ